MIVKPDVGVGANDTFKLSCDADLKTFFDKKISAPYVMEEFITGDVCSYDAILNANSEPLFESMTVWHPTSIEVVSQGMDLSYYAAAQIPEKLRQFGRATAKAFAVTRRFVHFEFFRLTKAKAGLGNIGDFVGLEVNMRPAGIYATDLMNFAHSTDVYQIWADMVTENESTLLDTGEHCFATCANRRDCYDYVHSREEILEHYGRDVVMCERLPEGMTPQMGDQMYIARCPTQVAAEEFITFVQEKS